LNLFEKLGLEPQIVGTTNKPVIDVGADIPGEMAMLVDLRDTMPTPEANLEHAPALLRKPCHPLWHPRELYCAANPASHCHIAWAGALATRHATQDSGENTTTNYPRIA